MRNGFILLHRRFLSEDAWKNPERSLAWIDFCSMAAWEDYTAVDGVTFRRGELAASYGYLAKRWGKSKDTVFNWIAYWIGERQVERQPERVSERHAERWFVVNYAKYQDSCERSGERVGERSPEREGEQIERKEEKENRRINTYVCRPETESLFETIDAICKKYQIENRVNKKALDIIVERYVGKIHMKVEAQHCMSWLIGKNLRMVSEQRIGNWFKKAQEIQKREQLKQLERKEAEINPALAQRRKEWKHELKGFSQDQSISDFATSQAA